VALKLEVIVHLEQYPTEITLIGACYVRMPAKDFNHECSATAFIPDEKEWSHGFFIVTSNPWLPPMTS
jgi:hypothetical protein